jgi:hypothetical protein
MRRVQGLPFGVPGCAVFRSRREDPDGFIDTGQQIAGLPLYVSAEAVRVMGGEVGLVPREQVAEAKAEALTLRHRVTQLEDELDSVNRELDGIDGLTKRGLVVRKAPGRPKKTP